MEVIVEGLEVSSVCVYVHSCPVVLWSHQVPLHFSGCILPGSGHDCTVTSCFTSLCTQTYCSEVVAVFSPGPDPEKFSSSVHITVSLLLLQSQLNTAVVKICVAASFI